MASNRTHPARAGSRPVGSVRAAAGLRDGAIERSRSITKAIGVASVAAVAALAMYVSRAFPGHSPTTSGSTSNASGGSAAGSPTPGPSGGYSSNVSPPSAAPAPSNQRAPVVSGST